MKLAVYRWVLCAVDAILVGGAGATAWASGRESWTAMSLCVGLVVVALIGRALLWLRVEELIVERAARQPPERPSCESQQKI